MIRANKYLIWMLLFSPLFAYANIRESLTHANVRNIIIGGVELNIPRQFLIGSSVSKSDADATAILLAFTYPEIQGGMGNSKDSVFLWIEDTRKHDTASRDVFGKLMQGQEVSQEKWDNLKQVIAKRNAIIKERCNGEIPWYLSFIRWDNALMCDHKKSITQPQCELSFVYKELYILIVFNREALGKTERIKQSTLKLIKEWENINRGAKNEN